MRISPDNKLKSLLAACALLCVMAVLYEAAGRQWVEGYLERVARKAHYEGVIKPKGLTEHKALYWKPATP